MEEIKQSKNKFLMPTIIAGAVIIVVLLAIVLIAGGGSKKVVNQFAKGIENKKESKMCAALNSEMLELNDIDDDCEEYFDTEDIRFKNFKILDKKKMDKDDVEDIAAELEEHEYIDEEKDLKAVHRYKFSCKIREGHDTESEDYKGYIWVGKIKGKWSIIGITEGKEYYADFDIF